MSTINFLSSSDVDFWAITSYWNPIGYRRKYANYRLFRERLNEPLLAIELAYGRDFELGKEDADILVQLRGRDIMWQKERLLNVALRALPMSCRKVAWVDCDVVFEADDWARRTSRLLDRFALVQPFSHVHRMSPDWEPGQGQSPAAQVLRSVPFVIASGTPAATCLGRVFQVQIDCTAGYAWAAHRELLEQHHIYDACIIGAGDSAFARAAYGYFEDAIRIIQYLNRDHYLAWANPFYDAVRAEVGFLEGNLFHLWHGKPEHRRYYDRLGEVSRFQFDPFEDIAIDCQGVWRWNSDKREMHDYVRDYFALRMEDG
jgi:hypothetical protein